MAIEFQRDGLSRPDDLLTGRLPKSLGGPGPERQADFSVITRRFMELDETLLQRVRLSAALLLDLDKLVTGERLEAIHPFMRERISDKTRALDVLSGEEAQAMLAADFVTSADNDPRYLGKVLSHLSPESSRFAALLRTYRPEPLQRIEAMRFLAEIDPQLALTRTREVVLDPSYPKFERDAAYESLPLLEKEAPRAGGPVLVRQADKLLPPASPPRWELPADLREAFERKWRDLPTTGVATSAFREYLEQISSQHESATSEAIRPGFSLFEPLRGRLPAAVLEALFQPRHREFSSLLRPEWPQLAEYLFPERQIQLLGDDELMELADSDEIRAAVSQNALRMLQTGADLFVERNKSGGILRLLGVDKEEEPISDRVLQGLAARLKVMAELDPFDTTLAQEGTAVLNVKGVQYHAVVRTMPTERGENLSIEMVRQPLNAPPG